MGSSIRISERHGVNPSLEQCFYCGDAKGVVLFGRMRDDREAPRQVCLDHVPCDKCKGFMKQGIICIGVDDARSNGDMANPYRDGNWCVVTEDFIRRAITPPMSDHIAKKRCAFIPTDAWDALGLPKARRGNGARHDGPKEVPDAD